MEKTAIETHQAGHVSLAVTQVASMSKSEFLKSNIRGQFTAEYADDKVDEVMTEAYDACVAANNLLKADETIVVVPVTEPVKEVKPFVSEIYKTKEDKAPAKDDKA